MLWVGDDPNPVPYVWGANSGSWNAVPFRVIPDLGQVSENAVKPPSKESCDVLHNDDSGSYFANKAKVLTPEPRALALKPSALARVRDVLAGKSSANNVNWSDIFALQFGYVFKLANVRPVFRQHAPAEWVEFTKRHGLETACAFKAEGEAPNS